MATSNVEYHSSLWHKSWNWPQCLSTLGRTISFGFWLRQTVDRIIPEPLLSSTRSTPSGLYSQLDTTKRETRVLCLHPGKGNDPLFGHLEVFSCNLNAVGGTAQEYTALSYAWGEPIFARSITIDGFATSITRGLHQALLHLRLKDQPLRIWVDQLCINQDDILERNYQVDIMFDVYASAQRVFVWLGLSTPDSATGMMVLEDLARSHFKSHESMWQHLPTPSVAAGLRDILQRPWWSRMWVVQEAAVAREIVMICGDHRLSWSNDLIHVFAFARSLKATAISPQWQMNNTPLPSLEPLLQVLQMQLESGPERDRWKAEMPEPSLVDLAYNMRDRVTSDPHDMFYALKGLARNASGITLNPDYKQPVGALYRTIYEAAMRYNPWARSHLPAASHNEPTNSGADHVDISSSDNSLPTTIFPCMEQGPFAAHLTSIELPHDSVQSLEGASHLEMSDAPRPQTLPTSALAKKIDEACRRSKAYVMTGDLDSAAEILLQMADDMIQVPAPQSGVG